MVIRSPTKLVESPQQELIEPVEISQQELIEPVESPQQELNESTPTSFDAKRFALNCATVVAGLPLAVLVGYLVYRILNKIYWVIIIFWCLLYCKVTGNFLPEGRFRDYVDHGLVTFFD